MKISNKGQCEWVSNRGVEGALTILILKKINISVSKRDFEQGNNIKILVKVIEIW